MKKKILAFMIAIFTLSMMSTSVLAIGPQNAQNNPIASFPIYGVAIDAPSGVNHEWVNAGPELIHLKWMDAREFKIKNALVVTSVSEAAEIENKWMYFSMELWATWLYEKIPMLPYAFWLAWAQTNTPEGVYFMQVFVGE
jgi:hypothetical protein